MPSIRNVSHRSRRSPFRLLIALCAARLLAPGVAIAQDQPPLTATIVNSCVTDVDAGGTNLASALAAGGSITFACGGPATIRITRAHFITRGINVDGGGQITLDGNNETMLLLPNAPDVTIGLKDLTVRRMTNPAAFVIGSVVFSTENKRVHLFIVNSRILESNKPIFVANGEVTVENSVFERNTGTVIGAPIVTLRGARLRNNEFPIVTSTSNLSKSGQVDISDSTFEGNTGVSSFDFCHHVSIVRTSFVDNSTLSKQTTGGGAFGTNCPTDVENGTFTGNVSGSNGGAISVASGAQRVSIRGSRFMGNMAAGGGGAITVDATPGIPLAVVLQQTIFRNNRAGSGGAVFFEGPPGDATADATFTGRTVTFSGNTAADRGGAIAGRNAILDMSRSVFVRNTAQSGAAVWIDTAANRPSVFVNSLFALNKAPAGTIVGRAVHFINATVLGSDGPGLALLQPVAGGPAQAIHLSNSIVENNSGGNCSDPASIIDDGTNLQFPGTTCGGTITVGAALLDTFYAPMIGGPARARGKDAVCSGPKVQGLDLYGRKRPQTDHCSIGAVEGDLEQMLSALKRPATADRLDFLILLAEGRQTLMVRLIADARVEEAAALTSQTIADFRNYAGQSGADVLHAARDLLDLSAKLADKGRSAEAVMTQQAMVDVLGFTPATADRLDFLILLAEGRKTLMVRLIADARVEQAAALTGQTITDFRNYAGQSGADVLHAARDLSDLSARLTRAGRSAEAAMVQQAMIAIGGPG
jgi:predicted outer membrane repeat protein